ncbi:MAG: PAS domain S-box protein, partial [Sphingomonadales bacterium]|nr:PAS domain S-box protein [Sphingomonadales bacterium]
MSTHNKRTTTEASPMFQEVNDLILRSNQGYLVHDMGVPLFANQALADLVGLPDVEAVMAMPTAFALIHPDDRELVIKNATYRIEGQEDIPIDYEFRLIRQPDDEELWINCRAFPINWNSRPALAVSFFDVTDRKNLEAEQERLNHLFTNMFELTPLIITLTRHSDGRYIMVNGSFERTLGYSKAEATGRTPMELGVYDNQGVRDQNFKALEIGETRINNEIIGIAKDGRRFMASFSSTRLNVYGEDLILFIGRDITDERKQQEALQNS